MRENMNLIKTGWKVYAHESILNVVKNERGTLLLALFVREMFNKLH